MIPARSHGPGAARRGFKSPRLRRERPARLGASTAAPPPTTEEDLRDRVWQLSETVETLRAVIDAGGDVAIARDASGRHAVDADYERLFAAAPEDLLARFAGDDVASLPTRAGPRWFRLIRVPPHPGSPDLVLLRDVTAAKEAEAALAAARDAAEAASAAKSRFLAMASHEIRTPLNGILGMAALLADTPLTPEQATYQRAIRVSGEALLSLVGEVLDFTRIEAGRLDLAPVATDPAQLVEEVVELLAPRAQAKGLEIAGVLPRGLPRRVRLDPDRLRQVLVNLVGNAVKFTEAGGVAVDLDAVVEGSAATLRFTVADTGIGLTPENVARVFEAYEQADQGAARREDGTGLGLPIARAIVRAMGGEIEVESAPGRGSVFRFAVTVPVEFEAAAETRPLAGLSARLLSDGPFEAERLARRLVEAGATVVGTGRADVVLVDHGAAAGLGAADLAALGGRALVLLAPAERAELPELRVRGFDGYLVKPVRTRSAIDAVAGRFAAAGLSGDPRDERLPPPAATTATPLDVLVCDDNPVNLLLTRTLVEKRGHRAACVADGAAAVAAAEARLAGGAPFDLVLMDLHMPGLDGHAATRAIRAAERGAGRARARILILTADTTSEAAAAALAAGADDTLAKPLDPAAFDAALAARRG